MKKSTTSPSGWFYLEPYVYLETVPEQALLLNTLDRQSIRTTAPELVTLLAKLRRPASGGVVKIGGRVGASAVFQSFLREVRAKFMGDWLDLTTYPTKPVQPHPFISVMHDARKRQFAARGSYRDYLHELTIHVDTHCPQSCADCFSVARQTEGCTSFPAISSDRIADVLEKQLPHLSYMPHLYRIHLIATTCFQTDKGNRLCELLHDFREICRLTIHAANLPALNETARRFFSSRITVLADEHTPLPSPDAEFLSYTWMFLIRSAEAYRIIRQKLADLPGLTSYCFRPVYTGCNDAFFRESVYVNPEELLQNAPDLKEIHRNSLVNSYFFGRLTLTPDGDVRTHLGAQPLGNLRNHTWEILIKRACSRKDAAWFRVRGRQDCGACLYKNLCPPLSVYEEATGQSCLCSIAGGKSAEVSAENKLLAFGSISKSSAQNG